MASSKGCKLCHTPALFESNGLVPGNEKTTFRTGAAGSRQVFISPTKGRIPGYHAALFKLDFWFWILDGIHSIIVLLTLRLFSQVFLSQLAIVCSLFCKSCGLTSTFFLSRPPMGFFFAASEETLHVICIGISSFSFILLMSMVAIVILRIQCPYWVLALLSMKSKTCFWSLVPHFHGVYHIQSPHCTGQVTINQAPMLHLPNYLPSAFMGIRL